MSEAGIGEGLGVIFDIDGVLVDSYDAHLESWKRAARDSGVPFTDEDFKETFGMTSREIIRRFWPESSHDDGSISRIDGAKESIYRDLVSAHFPAMPGAVELIDALLGTNFTIGAGSSGPPENVELALTQLDRKSQFSGIVTGMDVSNGKPEPDVFLLCAEQMGILPGRCLVIEDAPAGIIAATRAGMRSAAFLSSGRSSADFEGIRPDITADSLGFLSPTRIAGIILESETE